MFGIFKFLLLRVIMVKSGERICKWVIIIIVYVWDYVVNLLYYYNII